MACLRHTWWMTASLSLWPSADNFDRPTSLHVRFQELAQVWVINPSILLDRDSQTYLSAYIVLNSPYCYSASCWRRSCLAEDRRASDCWFFTPSYKCTQQHMETCWCLGREWCPTDHKVLLFQVLQSGTRCHQLYVHRSLHSDSFRVD